MLEVLFDHCVPRPLRRQFGRGIKITEAQELGLEEVGNSALEKKAHKLGYGALITTDTDFAKPGHIPEFHIPVVLLRVFPRGAKGGLAVLIPGVERDLLAGMDPGVYVRDNCKGTILFSRSFDESEKLRKLLKGKEDSSR